MTTTSTFLLDRNDISDTHLHTQNGETEQTLAAGQVLLKVHRFSFTANNITYAAMGDALRYWEFFPAPTGKGIIPVWGFADVLVSRCDEIAVGERLYGYYPMSTHLVVEPQHISSGSFVDGAEHRQSLRYRPSISCGHRSSTDAIAAPVYHIVFTRRFF